MTRADTMNTQAEQTLEGIDLARRGFLGAGGALVIALAVPAAFGAAKGATAAPLPHSFDKPKSVAIKDVAGFLAIDDKGIVTLFTGKVDLGTGIRTALAQIVAEELDVPFEGVHLIEGDTLLTPDQGTTYGSTSIQIAGMYIRQAAATAREELRSRGARKMEVPVSSVRTANGSVIAETGLSVTYAELAAGAVLAMAVDVKAPVKDPGTYQVVGKPVRRVDIPAKVTGEFTYMHDFRIPGMLHARVIRPTGIRSELLSFDDKQARTVSGFVTTIRKGNFLAVVAKTEWGAVKASRLLQANWSEWKGLPERAKVYDHMRGMKIVKDEILQTAGRADAALKGASKVLTADYHFAIHTHGSIGPSCSVAAFDGPKLTVWTASQASHALRRQLASMLQMKLDDIRCIYLDGSGCYGRNGHEDASADAALIAREVGQPVRVQWMRHDEHGWDPKAVPTTFAMLGGLDQQGKLVAWSIETWLPDKPAEPLVPLLAAQHANFPAEVDHPGNVHRGLETPYGIPNIEAKVHWVVSTPFRPSWIRSPGRVQNNFAGESFFDEMAHAAGIDPFEARTRNLSEPRALELLQKLKSAVDWQPSKPRSKIEGSIARGRGMAYVKYEMSRTYVAAVADVHVDLLTGEVRVQKFTVAHDCGLIINPDGLKNQIDGNVIQTMSRTLVEELLWNSSNVTSLDWNSYPILRMPQIPKIDYVLIDRPSEKPWGAGEPSAVVIPPAIGNAIFDAIGVRLREVPFTPERVKAAIDAYAPAAT